MVNIAVRLKRDKFWNQPPCALLMLRATILQDCCPVPPDHERPPSPHSYVACRYLTRATGLGHVSLDSGSPNVMYNQPNIHQGSIPSVGRRDKASSGSPGRVPEKIPFYWLAFSNFLIFFIISFSPPRSSHLLRYKPSFQPAYWRRGEILTPPLNKIVVRS